MHVHFKGERCNDAATHTLKTCKCAQIHRDTYVHARTRTTGVLPTHRQSMQAHTLDMHTNAYTTCKNTHALMQKHAPAHGHTNMMSKLLEYISPNFNFLQYIARLRAQLQLQWQLLFVVVYMYHLRMNQNTISCLFPLSLAFYFAYSNMVLEQKIQHVPIQPLHPLHMSQPSIYISISRMDLTSVQLLPRALPSGIEELLPSVYRSTSNSTVPVGE